MATIILPLVNRQFWREALPVELLARVDEVNSRTRRQFMVRTHISVQRLKWWPWKKTTVYQYQVLRHIKGDEFHVVGSNLKDDPWFSLGTVMHFFDRLPSIHRIVQEVLNS